MQYKIIVDKQPSSNSSSEIKEYIIDIEELRVKGDIYDSLVITKGEDYVMRRLELTKYHKLNVLETPIKQPLTELNIELFEGDNYIYLSDTTGNKFYAEYLVKNDFTDMYVTNLQMNASIEHLANEIELSVNQKLTGYSTTQEMNAIIELLAKQITLALEGKLDGEKFTGASIILALNNDSSSATIDADKVSLNGKIINLTSDNMAIKSTNFNVDENGNTTIIDDIESEEEWNFSVKTQDGTRILKLKPFLFNMKNESTGTTFGIQTGGVATYGLNNGDSSNLNILSKNETYTLWRAKDSETSVSANAINIQNNSTGSKFGIQTGSLASYGLSNSGVQNTTVVSQSDTYTVWKSHTGETTVSADGIETPTVTQTSKESEKKNFEELQSGLDIIKNIDIYKYNLKNEEDDTKKHIGFVIGDNYKYSKEITSKENNGVDVYSFVSVCCKAIQEQQQTIENLTKRIEELEAK